MPSFSPSRFSVFAVTLAVCLGAPAAFAQQPPDSVPAHVSQVDGAVTLEREGQVEAADLNMPVVSGDRLRTTSGRIELVFPDGTVVEVDEDSSLELLSSTLLRLASGRMTLVVAGAGDPSRALRFQIDTPVARAETDGPGQYRIAVLGARDGETELAVVRGYATLATDRGSMAVRAGERSVAIDNGAPSRPQLFNSARYDAFDRWMADRRDDRTTTTSAQYLPGDLSVYGSAFDRYGSWQYTAPYGYVWYPVVEAGWRPYYNGYWSSLPSYGWTWVGADRWSWPTHHYGRWGQNGGSWFWIPGRSWAPAWVTWASAPGYVSWSPLGFDGRPVYGINAWTGWTVLPRTSFGYRGHRVDRYAVAPQQLPRSTAFIPQPSTIRGVAPSNREYPFGNRRSDTTSGSVNGSSSPAAPRRRNPGESSNESRPPFRDALGRRPVEIPRWGAEGSTMRTPPGSTVPGVVPHDRGAADGRQPAAAQPSPAAPASPIYRSAPVERPQYANPGAVRRANPGDGQPPPTAAAPRNAGEPGPSSRRAGPDRGPAGGGPDRGAPSGERAVPRGAPQGGDRGRQR